MNLVVPIIRHAIEQPNTIALSDGHKSLTYMELVQRIEKVAQGLHQRGLARDNVAILSTNRIEFAEVFLGAIYAGCVPIPVDPRWSSNEVNTTIQQTQPKLIFAESAYVNDLAGQDIESKLYIFTDGETGSYDVWLDRLNTGAEFDDSNELLFIGFTSGTTGSPKGYMRTHSSWIKSFEATKEAFQLNHMEHILAPGPFVHSLSLFALMHSLYNGATFHILQHFKAHKVLELCERIPNAILFVVPTMIESMLQLAVPGQTHIQALISSGGKWSEASIKKCREVFVGTKLYEFYGSSESSYISYVDVTTEDRSDSVGKPFPGVEISIRDEHFEEVSTGQIGQLFVRSELVFLGYHHLPEATKAVFQDGWLITGDYMCKDKDGFLYLVGRAKNRIISGGFNVFPEEIESVLQQHPAIQEVMVLGVPDDYWGEKITALVKWNGQQRLSLEEIKDYGRKHLAHYKAPKQIITMDQFIYTSSGKVARQAMKEYLRRVLI